MPMTTHSDARDIEAGASRGIFHLPDPNRADFGGPARLHPNLEFLIGTNQEIEIAVTH